MELSGTDKDLLQLLAIEVPWSMVCGEFHGQFATVEALVKRLFELRDAGLVQIISEADEDAFAEAAALCAEAAVYDNFEDVSMLSSSNWRLAATAQGYALIEADLDEQ